MRTVTPEEFISAPMRMYIGAAKSGKLSAALASFCGTSIGLMPTANKNAPAASAMVT